MNRLDPLLSLDKGDRMAKILAVGTDAALLYTRALVLERTGAFVHTAPPGVALELLDYSLFNLVVICHSVRHGDADEVANRVRACQPGCRILRLGSGSPVGTAPGNEHRIDLHSGPRALMLAAKRLLHGDSDTGMLESAAPVTISTHLHQLRQLQRQAAPDSPRLMPSPHREGGKSQGGAEL